MQNHVIIEPVATDFVQGVSSGVVSVVNNSSGNWLPFSPTNEWQSGKWGDKDICVTEANHQSHEVSMTQQISIGNIPQTHLDFLKQNGYFDANGKINFSERFSAILNGTTDQGNSLNNVAQCTRVYGLIPESLLPNDQTLTWDQFFDKTKITQAMLDLGKKFLFYFAPTYQWIVTGATDPTTLVETQLGNGILVAPLQIAGPVCPTWSATIVEPCGLYATTHSTLLMNIHADKKKDILDHYAPFIKTLDSTYPIPYAMQNFLSPNDISLTFTFHFTKDIAVDYPNGNDLNEVKALQKAMMSLSLVNDPYLRTFSLIDSMGGYYAPNFVAAVKVFQAKHGISPASGTVGLQTRAALNSIFNH